MSKVVSLRLHDKQVESLRRAARRLGRTPSEAAAVLLDEALRQRDFPFIEFRDSTVGRQAYLQGTRLAVWQIALVARDYGNDLAKTVVHFELPSAQVQAALNYAAAYADEVDDAIADNEATADEIERLLPNTVVVGADEASA